MFGSMFAEDKILSPHELNLANLMRDKYNKYIDQERKRAKRMQEREEFDDRYLVECMACFDETCIEETEQGKKFPDGSYLIIMTGWGPYGQKEFECYENPRRFVQEWTRGESKWTILRTWWAIAGPADKAHANSHTVKNSLGHGSRDPGLRYGLNPGLNWRRVAVECYHSGEHPRIMAENAVNAEHKRLSEIEKFGELNYRFIEKARRDLDSNEGLMVWHSNEDYCRAGQRRDNAIRTLAGYGFTYYNGVQLTKPCGNCGKSIPNERYHSERLCTSCWLDARYGPI